MLPLHQSPARSDLPASTPPSRPGKVARGVNRRAPDRQGRYPHSASPPPRLPNPQRTRRNPACNSLRPAEGRRRPSQCIHPEVRRRGKPRGPGRADLRSKDNIAVGGVPMTEGSHSPAYPDGRRNRGRACTRCRRDHVGCSTWTIRRRCHRRDERRTVARTRSTPRVGGRLVRRSRLGRPLGAVDLALGVDQGGSGRIPAAWCGLVCIKATHGLVPAVGSATSTTRSTTYTDRARVRDAANLLEAIAARTGATPRWVRGAIITTNNLSEAEGEGVAGMRIGVIGESLSGVDCDPAVAAA